MFENICYKKPFLKEVILRIDFPSPLDGLEEKLPNSISRKALLKFPISEPQKAHSQELQFSSAGLQAKSTKTMHWVFHGKEREKTLIITPDSIVVIVKKYKSYESFLSDIEEVLSELYKNFKELSASRVGLRYVNVLEINEDEPLSWKKYVNEGILGIIDFQYQKENLTRAFHIIEYNFDGQAVKYQFGIANPDFPALIKRKHFVIDIDSYFNGTFELQEIKENIEKSHQKIQDIFEKSITDETRALMKRISNE